MEAPNAGRATHHIIDPTVHMSKAHRVALKIWRYQGSGVWVMAYWYDRRSFTWLRSLRNFDKFTQVNHTPAAKPIPVSRSSCSNFRFLSFVWCGKRSVGNGVREDGWAWHTISSPYRLRLFLCTFIEPEHEFVLLSSLIDCSISLSPWFGKRRTVGFPLSISFLLPVTKKVWVSLTCVLAFHFVLSTTIV